VKALKRSHPELAGRLEPVVLYNDRAPRPGEQDGIDYHFRTRDEIEALRGREGFTVMEVRGDLQALDGNELRQVMERSDAFFEGNPFVGAELLSVQPDTTTSAFLAPLSREEIVALRYTEQQVDLRAFVTDVMRRKLLRRTLRQKGILSLKDLESVERRAGSAYREMQMACRFSGVIVNHDGEDSENWDAFYYPVGDARKALLTLVSLLEGSLTPDVERWEKDLLP
jgi:guanylate kinase